MKDTVTLKEQIIELRFSQKKSLREISNIIYGTPTKESNVRYHLKNAKAADPDKQQSTSLLTQEELDSIIKSKETQTPEELASIHGVPVSIINKIIAGEITSGTCLERDEIDPYVARLHNKNQRNMDLLRLERKHRREAARVTNVLEELTTELINTFSAHKLSEPVFAGKVDVTIGDVVGVIQLSDLHFGERIVEIADNVFDTSVICARLKKFADSAIRYFKATGVQNVLIAMTGDLVNSDRRLDEIVGNAGNRADILFTAVDVLQQFIAHISSEFAVTVASVCGNESRIGKDIGWATFIASDSFDAIIHNTLSRLFSDWERVRFVEMHDPLECVVNVNGSHFLLVHGHNGLSSTKSIETEVAKTKAKYANRGIAIDYVISGHIHQCYISDQFARSSGLPGGNAYSDKALNLSSKASQNLYLVHKDGSIDGVKVDLQVVDKSNAYQYNEQAEAYKPVSEAKNVIIQCVIV